MSLNHMLKQQHKKILTPAEDAEMFAKTAEWLSTLDEGDKVELLMELGLYNAEQVIEMKLACDIVIEGMKDADLVD